MKEKICIIISLLLFTQIAIADIITPPENSRRFYINHPEHPTALAGFILKKRPCGNIKRDETFWPQIDEKTGKYGYVNPYKSFDEWVIEPKFYPCGGNTKFHGFRGYMFFYDDLGVVAEEEKGKCGYINRKGKWVIKPKYDWAEPFYCNHIALVANINPIYTHRKLIITFSSILLLLIVEAGISIKRIRKDN